MILSYNYKFLENGEKVLILYMDKDFIDDEFSLEWLDKFKNKTWKDFLRKHSILWEGCKVILVVGGVTLAVLHNPVSTSFNYPDYVTENTFLSTVLIDKGENEIKEEIKQEEIGLEQKIEKENQINDNFIKEESNNTDKEIENNSSILNKVEHSGTINKNQTNEKPITNNNNANNNANSNTNNNVGQNIPNTGSGNANSNGNVSFDTTFEEEEKENNVKEEIETPEVVVYRSNGVVEELSMEDYLIGVVSAEMPASFNKEALKVQSILARTYALKRMEKGLILTDTVSTQRYINKSEMKKMWQGSFDKYYEKIKSVVRETEDMVVLYRGELIDAVYHSTSNGFTEDSENVWGNKIPYLVSVDSSWDKNVSSYLKNISFDNAKLLSIFGLSREDLTFEVLSRNRSGRVEEVQVGERIYSGVELREVLGLRSSDFELSYDGNNLTVTTRGYGHGVGLSQYGANEMAKKGFSYSEIIKHYYVGVDIVKK